MKRNRMTIFAVVSAILVLAFVLVVLYFFDSSGRTPPVTLPSPGVTRDPQTTADPGLLPDALEITTENIQAVIASLDRPEAYTRTLAAETLWPGGRASYNISVSVLGGCARTTTSRVGSASIRTAITTPTMLYIWYDNSGEFYEGPLGSAPPAEPADAYAMVPSYEDVLSLPRDAILEAALRSSGNDPVLYVKARSPLLGYIEEYEISAKTGLLTAARSYDGETLLYSAVASDPHRTPSEADFLLPDGRNVLDLH